MSFTPRVFKTAARESKAPEEEEVTNLYCQLICKSQSSSSFYFCLCVIASTPVSYDNHVMFIKELFYSVQLCNSETDHPPPPPAPSSLASQVLHWSKHLTFHSIGYEMKINEIFPIKELTLNLGIRHLTPLEFVRIQSFLFSG